jgi:hypothetical protein
VQNLIKSYHKVRVFVFLVASVLHGELKEITAQDDFESDTKDNNFICEMAS